MQVHNSIEEDEEEEEEEEEEDEDEEEEEEDEDEDEEEEEENCWNEAHKTLENWRRSILERSRRRKRRMLMIASMIGT